MQDHDTGIVEGPVFHGTPKQNDPDMLKDEENAKTKAEFIDGLLKLKETFERQRWSYVKRYSEWLASLTDDFFNVLATGCEIKNLISRDELEKARALGKNEIPEHVARNPVITIEYWKRLQVERPKDAEKLADPNRCIDVKINNSLTSIKAEDFGDLGVKETKRIILPNHPEVGLLNPKNDPPIFPKADRVQTFGTVTGIKLIDGTVEIQVTTQSGIKVCARYLLNKGNTEQKKTFQSILDFLS